MVVRNYASADFSAVCAIYEDAKRAELRFEPASFAITPLARDQAILAAFEASRVLVFERHAVVGFAAVCKGQLRALFVASEARGTGVGTALLGAVLDNAADLALNVTASNLPARQLYEKHGFIVAGSFVGLYDGKEVECLSMTFSAQRRQHDHRPHCLPGREAR